MKVMNAFGARVAATAFLIFGTTVRFSRSTLRGIVLVVLIPAMGTTASAQRWGDYLEESRRREESMGRALIEYVEASYGDDGAAFRVEYVRARLARPAEKWSRAIGASDLVDAWPGFGDTCESARAFRAFERALPSRVQVYDGSRMLVIDRGGAAGRGGNSWSGRLTIGFDESVRAGALNWWFLMWHRYPSDVLLTAVRIFEHPRPHGCDFLVFFPRDEKNLLMLSIVAEGKELLPVRQVATIVPSGSIESVGRSFVEGVFPENVQGGRFLYQVKVGVVSKGWSMLLPESVEGEFAWARGNRYRAWFRYRRDGMKAKGEFDVRSLPSEVAEGEDLFVLDELTGTTRDWRTGRTVAGGDLGGDQVGVAGAGKDGRSDPVPGRSTTLWAILLTACGALLVAFTRRALRSRGN